MKALVQDADERFIDHVQADGEKSKINTPPLLFAGTFPGGHSLHLCSKTIDGSHHGLPFTLANTIVQVAEVQRLDVPPRCSKIILHRGNISGPDTGRINLHHWLGNETKSITVTSKNSSSTSQK